MAGYVRVWARVCLAMQDVLCNQIGCIFFREEGVVQVSFLKIFHSMWTFLVFLAKTNVWQGA